MLLTSVSSSALPDEYGRGLNSNGDITFEKEGFLDNLFSIFSITGLSQQYQMGQIASIRVSQSLTQACTGGVYIVTEIYNSNKDAQTTATFCGEGGRCPYRLSDSYFVGSNKPSGYGGNWLVSFTIPSNIQTGTWSISSYFFCDSKGNTPANIYSTVDEKNFDVVGLASCSNECNTGEKACITRDGYRNRYLTKCGTYDSDSCRELATSLCDMDDCGGVDRCWNNLCHSYVKCTENYCDGDIYFKCGTDGILVDQGKVIGKCGVTDGGITPSPTPVDPTLTVPKLVEVSKEIIGTEGKITGRYTLKNTGVSMTSNWILEQQVNLPGVGVQAIYISPVKTCNSNTPENVHKEFKIGSGETATIELISNVPDSKISLGGRTVVYAVITEGCGCTEDTCYKEPYKAWKNMGEYTTKKIVPTITKTQIGLTMTDLENLKLTTKAQVSLTMESSGCNLKGECISGECIKIEATGLQASYLDWVTNPTSALSEWFVKKILDADLLRSMADALAKNQKKGICIVDFVPLSDSKLTQEVVKETVEVIDPKDIEFTTAKDLLKSSCSESAQCKGYSSKTSRCVTVNWLKQEDYITDSKEDEIISESKLIGTAVGGLGGMAGCTAIAGTLGIASGGVGAFVGIPLCIVTGGTIGYKVSEWLSGIGSGNPNAIGYCIPSDGGGVDLGVLNEDAFDGVKWWMIIAGIIVILFLIPKRGG